MHLFEYVLLSQPQTGIYSLVHAINFISDLHDSLKVFEQLLNSMKIRI